KFHSFFEASLVILFISLMHQYRNQESWRMWLDQMLRISAGLAIVVIPYLIFTAIQGNTSAMLHAALWYNLGYTDDAQSTIHILGTQLSASKLLLVAVIGILATIYYYHRKARLGFIAAAIAVVALSEYMAAIVSGRPYAHYALQVIPGLMLIIGFALQRKSEIEDRTRRYAPLVIVGVLSMGMWLGFTR